MAARHRPPFIRDQGRGRRRGRRERTTVEFARRADFSTDLARILPLIQPKLLAIVLDWGQGRGARLFPTRQLAAAATASLLIAGAFSSACSRQWTHGRKARSAPAKRRPSSRSCPRRSRRGRARLLRVIFAAEKPLEGELSLIAPDGSVAAKSRERHGGPPYFWFAEVASPAAGTWHATLARDRAPAECSTITREIAVRAVEPPRPRATRWQPLAVAQYLESRDGKPVFRLDREAVRRAARRGAVVAGAARGAARPVAQCPVQPSGPARGPDGADHSPRLRRPSVLPARVFRVQDGAAVRIREVHARGGAGEAPKCHEWWNIQNLEEARLAPAAPPEQIAAPASAAEMCSAGRPRSRRSRCAPKPPAPPGC